MLTRRNLLGASITACAGAAFDAVILGAGTAGLHPNPHYNHFGDRDCNTCHKGYEKSTLTCNQCHKFDLKTP